ncbi:MAG: transcription elongation factor GreA [Oscillospiraceae bacterium]
MYDELTEIDLKKMREEIEHRTLVLRPQIIEDVKTARAFGDLSENFEYKAAKREKNRNDSRIRYLEHMISTAKIIEHKATADDQVGLFDCVTIYIEEDDAERDITLVTTLRQNALKDLISRESPVGRAVLGRHVGDRVRVEVSETYGYWLVIRAIKKGEDDDSLKISGY